MGGTAAYARAQQRCEMVAIKMVSKQFVIDEADGRQRQQKVQRLLNERRILQQLVHPFVVGLKVSSSASLIQPSFNPHI